jgi:hypothetical protein
MNSYLLTRLFYQELEKSEAMQIHCRPQHQALFFRIIQIQNQVGWQTKSFDLPTDNTMFYTCIGSYKTYKKCFADLLSWDLIRLVSPAKNQFQARKVSLYTKKWTAFFTEAGAKQLPEQDQRTAGTTTNADTNAGSTHCQSTDQCSAEASPVNKTSKLLNEETTKPLNLETFKHTYLAEQSNTVQNFIDEFSEINFSSKENAVDRTVNESPPQEEKKKVAPKRNESSAKLKDTSTSLSIESNPKRKDKPDLLFKDSPYADKAIFVEALAGSAYAGANLEYYHELVKNWSESKQARKKDWLATVKNWMLRDFKEGKLVTYEPTSYTQPTTVKSAGKNGYSVLGNAIDEYFERKYGK